MVAHQPHGADRRPWETGPKQGVREYSPHTPLTAGRLCWAAWEQGLTLPFWVGQQHDSDLSAACHAVGWYHPNGHNRWRCVGGILLGSTKPSLSQPCQLHTKKQPWASLHHLQERESTRAFSEENASRFARELRAGTAQEQLCLILSRVTRSLQLVRNKNEKPLRTLSSAFPSLLIPLHQTAAERRKFRPFPPSSPTRRSD